LRKRFYWKLRDREVALGAAPLTMAVIPVTPEAAPDGEKYIDADRAFARALHSEEQGADLIELSVETLRPGLALTGEETQIHRLVPVLKRLRGKLAIPVIVRTRLSGVAQRAIEHGADAIFDPSGLTSDIALAKEVSNAGLGLMLGQMRGGPEMWARLGAPANPVATAVADLQAAIHRAIRANLTREMLMVDPALGLGKRKEENASLLAGMNGFNRNDVPFAVHLDSLAGQPADLDAAIVAAVLGGAYLIAVFNVGPAIPLIRAADAIASAQIDTPAEPEAPPPKFQRSR